VLSLFNPKEGESVLIEAGFVNQAMRKKQSRKLCPVCAAFGPITPIEAEKGRASASADFRSSGANWAVRAAISGRFVPETPCARLPDS
jgi:hypothetical protein